MATTEASRRSTTIVYGRDPPDSRPEPDPDAAPGTLLSSLQPERQIWSLRYGPCFCHSAAGASDSFDFIRFRTSTVDGALLERNVLVLSDRVIDGSLPVFHMVLDQISPPRLVIAAATCPNASRFWDELPVGWTSVWELLTVDARIPVCIGGKPEALLETVLAAQANVPRAAERV